jgi:primosomal protein N' (replication factor Y)
LQAKIIHHLNGKLTSVPVSSLKELGASLATTIKRLEKLELVEVSTSSRVQFESASLYSTIIERAKPKATASQEMAISAISESLNSKSFAPFLLYGVTGSGKTEVYMSAIEEALKRGGSALVVVPEIALTPQLTDQFQSRLKTPLAILHSKVGNAERWEAWESLLKGERRVAVGARSAIFAPIKNLSLIIVDEEHESSYKQSDGLHYNARDIALMRAKFMDCPVVLGSATPSFESLLNVKQGRYKLLEMPERVSDRPLPTIEIVDLSKIKRKEMSSENVSPELHDAIKETLENKGQVIILYNRRGFSSYLQCESCQEVVNCPNCSVALTYHKRRHALLCHYCDLRLPEPKRCSFCCDPNTTRLEDQDEDHKIGLLAHRGGGTEKVVDEIQEMFPDATLARMDRDTVGAKDSYRVILDSVRSGETDILIGTQMIAKGHDLPGVTLVGVIDADIGLHLPDFRTSEKTFQLITQAAGRAGRGEEPGRVIVQTRQPNHPTIVATVTGRFKAFARYEIDQRKLLSYPPWGRLLRLVISATDINIAENSAAQVSHVVKDLVEQLTDDTSAVSVLGPSTAALERLRGRFRWNILIKSQSKKMISTIASSLYEWRGANLNPNARLSIDVDPIDML